MKNLKKLIAAVTAAAILLATPSTAEFREDPTQEPYSTHFEVGDIFREDPNYYQWIIFAEGLAAVAVRHHQTGDEKWGYIDEDYKVVIPFIYDYAFMFNGGLAAVKVGNWTPQSGYNNSKWGVINTAGEIVLPIEYDSACALGWSGFISVLKDGKGGVYNASGEIVIPIEYTGGMRLLVLDCGKKIAMVCHSDWSGNRGSTKMGVLDSNGNVLIPVIYDSLWIDGNGDVHVTVDGNRAIINLFTGIIVPEEDDSTCPFGDEQTTIFPEIGDIYTEGRNPHDYFSHGLVPATIWDSKTKSRKWGFVDEDFKVVVPLIYDHAIMFVDGLAAVALGSGEDQLWGFINTKGEVIIPIEHDHVNPYGPWHDGYVYVRKEQRNGIYDTSGNLIIPTEYGGGVNIITLNCGRKLISAVHFDGFGPNGEYLIRSGVLDMDGNVIVPFIYRSCVINADGTITVYLDGKFGVLDAYGKFSIPAVYDLLYPFSEGFAAVRNDGKWGFINTSNALVIPMQFDFVSDFDNCGFKDGFVTVGNKVLLENGMTVWRYGIINTKGEFVLPIEYDEIYDETPELKTYRLQGILTRYNRKGQVINFDLDYPSIDRLGGGLSILRVYNLVKGEREKYLIGRGGEMIFDNGIYADFEFVSMTETEALFRVLQFGDTGEPLWEEVAVPVSFIPKEPLVCNCSDCADKPNAGKRGHVLGRVVISTEDALEILKFLVSMNGNLIERCESSRRAAQIVSDSGISTADALEILKHIVGLTDLTLD